MAHTTQEYLPEETREAAIADVQLLRDSIQALAESEGKSWNLMQRILVREALAARKGGN